VLRIHFIFTGPLRNVNNAVRFYELNGKGESETSKKRKENKSPMPAASAGLLRFFEEETEGVKIRPELLVGLAVALIVVSVIAKIFF
jgi:preprotein translocase subunit Sec61beta